MKLILITFTFTLLLFVTSIENYQSRRIYYNEEDNVCAIGEYADSM